MAGKSVQRDQVKKGAVESLRSTINSNAVTHELKTNRQGCLDDSVSRTVLEDEEGYFVSSGSLVPVSLVRSFYELSALDVNGKMVQFSRFEGRVVLVMCVATGDEQATREFTQMNEFVSAYDCRGLSILAFPCDQFGNKEPWHNHEIPLCMSHVRPGRGFAPKFHLMGKCEVNGPRSHPVFEYLKQRLPGWSDEPSATIRSLRGKLLPPKAPDVRWNFEKFLISYDGKPYKRFLSSTPLIAIAGDVEHLLRSSVIVMMSTNSRHGGNKFLQYDPTR
ncbi:glutathione peroxidase 2-like [Asterias amurensis]|uniref:glutathione peroxidase 2-like n=1 Tax=Asterias amurensis TaxID=7602 RepID=UPI003AB25114